MSKKTLVLITINLVILNIGFFAYFATLNSKNHTQEITQQTTPEIIEPEVLPPIKNNVTETLFNHYSYDQMVEQLKEWNKKSPETTDVEVYGKSTKGKDLYYIKVGNKRIEKKDVILITACIHGNEPLASDVLMSYINELLLQYNEDGKTHDILDSRDIYFVPIVSPDSYTKTREVDGVDPNRNFPYSNMSSESVTPVKAVQNLFLKIKPNSVITMHTWGRVYLSPYGDTMRNCPHHEDYVKLMKEMSKLSGYKYMRACDLYKPRGLNIAPQSRTEFETVLIPIFGTEVDWYYRNKALAIVMEVGTHQRVPTSEEIKDEYRRTWEAFTYFLRESPKINKSWNLN